MAGVIEQTGAEIKGQLPGERVVIAPAVACGSCHYCFIGKKYLCPSGGELGTTSPKQEVWYSAMRAQEASAGIVKCLVFRCNTFSSKVEEHSRNIIRNISMEAKGFADGIR